MLSILGLKGQGGGHGTRTWRQRGLGEGCLAGVNLAESHQHLDRALLQAASQMTPVTLPRGVSPSWPSHAERSRPEGPAGHRGSGAMGLFLPCPLRWPQALGQGAATGQATERGVQWGGSQASRQRPAPMVPGYAPLGSAPHNHTAVPSARPTAREPACPAKGAHVPAPQKPWASRNGHCRLTLLHVGG